MDKIIKTTPALVPRMKIASMEDHQLPKMKIGSHLKHLAKWRARIKRQCQKKKKHPFIYHTLEDAGLMH
jgi:hypothetical protein